MKKILKLPEIQRVILKKAVIQQPQRPKALTMNQIYKEMSYKKYTEEQVESGLRELVNSGYFEKGERDSYVFPRDKYFEVRNHFRFSVFFSDANPTQVFSLFSVGLATAGLFTAIGIYSSGIMIEGNKIKNEQEPALLPNKTVMVEQRLNVIEAKFDEILKIPDDQKAAISIAKLNDDFRVLNQSTSTLMNLVSKDPSKLVELSLLRSEIEQIGQRQDDRYSSLSREIDKISSYNTTIIAFMITFLVGLLGFGVFNYLRDRASSHSTGT